MELGSLKYRGKVGPGHGKGVGGLSPAFSVMYRRGPRKEEKDPELRAGCCLRCRYRKGSRERG